MDQSREIDAFIDDLDELGNDSSDAESQNEDDGENQPHTSTMKDVDEDPAYQNENSADIRFDNVLERLAAKNLASIALLKASPKFQEHMANIRIYQAKPSDRLIVGPIELDPEYKLIVSSNQMLTKIEDEIDLVYKYVVEKYAKKFPELETLVTGKVDYAKVVKRIGNEMDMTKVELNDLLPSASVMVVSVTGSTTNGQELTDDELKEVLGGCDELLELDESKRDILRFIESRMSAIAPNVSAVVGTAIAAQLVGLAGGLVNMAKMPSCNLQVLGQTRKHLSGFSSSATLPHTGLIYYCDLIQSAPVYLRQKACRTVAGKLTLAARVDSYQQDSKGLVGMQFYETIREKIEKWQEPEKAKTKKALPIPDEKPRKKRGGKRYRKMKERMQSEVRKELNRQTFATADDEYGDNAMGIEFGMLGKAGSGKLRVMQKEQRQTSKKLRQINAGSSGATSGLASSLAFTPVQGLELVNPEAAQERIRQANKRYFGATSFINKDGAKKPKVG